MCISECAFKHQYACSLISCFNDCMSNSGSMNGGISSDISVTEIKNQKIKKQKETHNMRNMKCGGVKAPSAWLTYIGSLPLTSHHGSSLTNRGLHMDTHKDTHTLYPTLRRLCSLMLRLDSFSSSFPLPSSLPALGHLCVVRYED